MKKRLKKKKFMKHIIGKEDKKTTMGIKTSFSKPTNTANSNEFDSLRKILDTREH